MGSGAVVQVIRGTLPTELSGSGYGSGSGDGCGYGSGAGSGYGCGSGYGYGSGSGDGDGSGDGYGYGSGSGDGDGDGSGYGYGSGSGDGYGYGDCDGEKTSGLTVAQRQLPAHYADDPRTLALWKSDADGKPANGGSSDEAARPGLRQTTQGPLSLCHKGTLHATLEPERWKGERLWIVALEGEVVGDAEKMGALTREILCEVKL